MIDNKRIKDILFELGADLCGMMSDKCARAFRIKATGVLGAHF